MQRKKCSSREGGTVCSSYFGLRQDKDTLEMMPELNFDLMNKTEQEARESQQEPGVGVLNLSLSSLSKAALYSLVGTCHTFMDLDSSPAGYLNTSVWPAFREIPSRVGHLLGLKDPGNGVSC